jgi:pyruvate,water dikinase
MVPAECAGVVFTVDPVHGHDTEMLIEAVPGLGDILVQGERDPSAWRYDWMRDLLSREGAEGDAPLDDSQVRELAALAVAIQAHYGAPQDIEWAWCRGRFHVLQSRAIAAIHHDLTEQWTNADFKDGGVAAHIPCALMWSLYEGVLETSMPAYLATIGLLARPGPNRWTLLRCGFPYWNLSAVKAGLRRIPGFVEREFDADLGIAPSYPGDGARTALTPRTLFAGLRTLFGIRRSVRRRLRAAPATLAELDALLVHLDAIDPDALDDRDLAAHVEAVLATHHRDCESRYFNTIYDNSNAATLFRETLGKRNQRRRRRGRPEHDYLALAGGLSDVPHLAPVTDLWRVSRRLRASTEDTAALLALDARELCRRHLAGEPYPGEDAIRAHIHAHRHRSQRELDLLVPCWDEDPLPVFESLLGLLGRDDNEGPELQQERSQARYRAALAELDDAGLRRELEVHRAMLGLRERMRDRSTRMYRLVRLAAMAVGRRLLAAGLIDTPDMVMHLAFPELIALARAFATPGSGAEVATLLALSRRRHDYHRGFRNYPRPNEIMPRASHAPSQAVTDPHGLRGIVCSPGVVEGTLRVLDGIEQASQVRDGEILVTAYTDPAWTPLFARIGGLITETGGVLSHGAVVSREYGIPAVLGVKGARQRLRTGMRVRLDGETGVITPLPAVVATPEAAPVAAKVAETVEAAE